MVEALKAWLIRDYRFLRVAKWSAYNFFVLFYDLRAEGREHIPPEGGVIIACNHFSSVDPPIMGSSTNRLPNFMAKKELFAHPASRFLMEILHAYPVDRQANDMQSIKTSLRKLEAGEAIGIFFEGRRNQGEAEARGGTAFLAQRANVPIVPAAIWREGRAYRVRFGTPIFPDKVITTSISRKEKLQKLTERLSDDVKALRG